MESIERRVAREVKAMTRKEVIVKTIAGELTWIGPRYLFEETL